METSNSRIVRIIKFHVCSVRVFGNKHFSGVATFPISAPASPHAQHAVQFTQRQELTLPYSHTREHSILHKLSVHEWKKRERERKSRSRNENPQNHKFRVIYENFMKVAWQKY